MFCVVTEPNRRSPSPTLTDAVSGADVDRRAAHYRPQGAAYAMAAGAAAGQEVREVIFAFLRPGAESAFPLDGAAREEVRRAAGRIHAGWIHAGREA